MTDTATVESPKTTEPDGKAAPHGSWFWHELTTPDTDGAAAFYKSVLGWSAAPMPGMADYTLIMAGETPTGGMMKMVGPIWDGIPPHWMLYIKVDSITKAKADVEANGGKIHHGPFTAEGVGTILVCADPQGAVFSLIEPV